MIGYIPSTIGLRLTNPCISSSAGSVFSPSPITRKANAPTSFLAWRRFAHSKCNGKLTREDLTKMDVHVKKATFAEIAPLYKPRADEIKKFLYFDTKIKGEDMQIQVGKKVWEAGKHRRKQHVKYVTYCIKKR